MKKKPKYTNSVSQQRGQWGLHATIEGILCVNTNEKYFELFEPAEKNTIDNQMQETLHIT